MANTWPVVCDTTTLCSMYVGLSYTYDAFSVGLEPYSGVHQRLPESDASPIKASMDRQSNCLDNSNLISSTSNGGRGSAYCVDCKRCANAVLEMFFDGRYKVCMYALPPVNTRKQMLASPAA